MDFRRNKLNPFFQGAFMNEGSKEGVLGGLHSYTAGAGEGEGNFKWICS